MGPAPGNDATCGNRAADVENPFLFVEEVEVEREAHAKGVDARATWDQEAGTGTGAIEEGETEQAGMESRRDPNLLAERSSDREVAQARGETTVGHAPVKGPRGQISPPL
jgi:hypothetical protein